MNKRPSPWLRLFITLTRPPVRALGFTLWGLYWIVFGWWLDERLVKRSNEKFAGEIRQTLPFLFSDYDAAVIPNDEEPPASNDFAHVTVTVADLILRFYRGRGTISITVSSTRYPKKLHDLSSVLNLIDSDVERRSYCSLLEVELLLRLYMKHLTAAFSENTYEEIDQRLCEVYASDRAVTRQWENEINRKLYG